MFIYRFWNYIVIILVFYISVIDWKSFWNTLFPGMTTNFDLIIFQTPVIWQRQRNGFDILRPLINMLRIFNLLFKQCFKLATYLRCASLKSESKLDQAYLADWILFKQSCVVEGRIAQKHYPLILHIYTRHIPCT